MSIFADIRETRQLGAPIVGLYRTALGRDPGPDELAALVPLIRDRAPLAIVAEEIVEKPEYVACYEGLSRQARAAALCRNAFGATGPEFAEWTGTEAELVAAIADTALTRRAIPLLPGLVPGATPDDPVAYAIWTAEYDRPRPGAGSGGDTGRDTGRDTVSLLMRAGDTEAEAVGRSVASLQAQHGAAWELCLSARTLSPWSRRTIDALVQDEPRVRLAAEHSLFSALAASTGALVGILEPGDRLAPDALARVAAAFAPAVALVFTDEDVEDAGGRHSPRLKPGYSPDLLFDGHAIGRLAVMRRDVLHGADLDGSDADLALARHAAGRLSRDAVRHLPFVALHRAAAPRALEPALFAGAPFALPDPAPTVTAIILTKDGAELLDTCVRGVLDRTDYPALDVILVDNGTTEPDALALLTEFEQRPRVTVLRQPGPFNFAALNNAAMATVSGGLLLLLNNDVEVLEPGWLAEMVAQLARPGVGIVGARLLYPDRTVQHAGLLLGPAGAATHVGRGAPETATGYFGQLTGVRDFSAVTGACLAIAVNTWRAVGGMNERLAVTWNDVDLCLRVRRAGQRVVWTPRATLIHRESVTRGLEAADAAKLARFREEQALVVAEWGDALEHDPFLNANLLALDSGSLVLTRPRPELASPS